MADELLRLEKINMVFAKRGANLFKKDNGIHVLKDVDLTINKGEIVALVGESGCGKTTIGKIITGLHKPTSGTVYFEGENVSGLLSKKIHSFSAVQFVQQDSYAALNPVKTIYESLYAPIKTKNRKWKKAQIDAKIDELMTLIGLQPAEQFLSKYPHQLSGGQRQRILMARAISLDPKLIVADEPVSMIDVSLRLSLLNLMTELNDKLGVSFVYITHDISTARYIAKNGRICVMYLGEIVEIGSVEQLLSSPKHPYTQALFSAVPAPDPDVKMKRIFLEGDIPSPANPPSGCKFHTRCSKCMEICKNVVPQYVEAEKDHFVACHLYNKEENG